LIITNAARWANLRVVLVHSCAIDEVKLLVPQPHADERGSTCELHRKSQLTSAGINVELVQWNLSVSAARGTVRGLHLQNQPHAQAKLVRVVRGAIFDVAVDIRRGSPTYGQHVALELAAKDLQSLFIPRGFLHGFCSLVDDTWVEYGLDDYYCAASEAGVAWNDPALGIPWPIGADDVVLSERDRNLGPLSALDTDFSWAHPPERRS